MLAVEELDPAVLGYPVGLSGLCPSSQPNVASMRAGVGCAG